MHTANCCQKDSIYLGWRLILEHRTGVMFKELLGKYETKVWYYRENSAASHMTASLLDTEYLKSS